MKKIIVKMALLGHLKNAEHFDLMEAIVNRSKEYVVRFTVLAALWKKFVDCFRYEDEIYKQILGREETKLVEEADLKRIRSTRRVRKTIESFRNSTVEEEKAAYRQLVELNKLYSSATYRSYRENSALITNFLQDLTSERYHEASEKLGLIPLIEEAVEDNEAFKETFRDRNLDIFVTTEEKLRLARKDTDTTFSAIATAINSLDDITHLQKPGSEEAQMLQDIIARISAELKSAELAYARRVPSYNMPGASEEEDNGNEDGDDRQWPYDLNVQKQIKEGQTQTVIDSDQEAFAHQFEDVSLEEAELWEKGQYGKTDTSFYFLDYYYDDGNLAGITLHTDRQVILRSEDAPKEKSRKPKGHGDETFTLERDGVVLVTLSDFKMPQFILKAE